MSQNLARTQQLHCGLCSVGVDNKCLSEPLWHVMQGVERDSVGLWEFNVNVAYLNCLVLDSY